VQGGVARPAGHLTVSGLELADEPFVFTFGCVDLTVQRDATRTQPFDQVQRFGEISSQFLDVSV
jgi:hypothetical protein